MTESATIITDDTDFPVCPNCGTDHQDWWDGLEAGKGDGDSWVRTCGDCGQKYKITLHVSYSFDTESVSGGRDDEV